MKRLFDTFPVPDKGEWTKAASGEIGGKDPFEALQWTTPDQQKVLPCYGADDIKTLDYLSRFSFVNQNGGLSGARSWANIPPVYIADEETANKSAIEHLQNEAEGILFYSAGPGVRFEQLLNTISWEHCTISFIAESNFPVVPLQALIKDKEYNPKFLQGSIFWKGLPPAIEGLPAESGFRYSGICTEASTPVEEISTALKTAAAAIDRYVQSGGKAETIIRHISFSLPLGTQFMLDISKMRALRMLWYQVVQAYGISSYSLNDVYIHGRSEPWINPAFQPHGNMLKSTVAALAAVSGQCNALTVCPEDDSNTSMRRIARNASVILRDESQFGKINDPFAGAYGVEILTDQIARDAWKAFQN